MEGRVQGIGTINEGGALRGIDHYAYACHETPAVTLSKLLVAFDDYAVSLASQEQCTESVR